MLLNCPPTLWEKALLGHPPSTSMGVAWRRAATSCLSALLCKQEQSFLTGSVPGTPPQSTKEFPWSIYLQQLWASTAPNDGREPRARVVGSSQSLCRYLWPTARRKESIICLVVNKWIYFLKEKYFFFLLYCTSPLKTVVFCTKSISRCRMSMLCVIISSLIITCHHLTLQQGKKEKDQIVWNYVPLWEYFLKLMNSGKGFLNKTWWFLTTSIFHSYLASRVRKHTVLTRNSAKWLHALLTWDKQTL